VKGLRLFVSMFLEVADVSLPLFKSALNNFSRVASWLLVTLIGALKIINRVASLTQSIAGRSLGLVYRGIKESLDPQSRVKFT